MNMSLPDTGEPFSPVWGNIKMRDTHKFEIRLTCILNKQLLKKDMVAKRVERNPFSPYDIGVYNYNLKYLKDGEEICKIDLERKLNDRFPKKGIPPRWTRGVSFLERKLEKPINWDRDVYVLFDNDDEYPRIIWATYHDIREFGLYQEFRGSKNRFRTLDLSHLHFGYESLVNWCACLKNMELPPSPSSTAPVRA
jgi:hypothetical protein